MAIAIACSSVFTVACSKDEAKPAQTTPAAAPAPVKQSTVNPSNMIDNEKMGVFEAAFSDPSVKNYFAVNGNTDTSMYILVDSNCPHCADLWRQNHELLEKADFGVKVIPVAFLGMPSYMEASAILNAQSPVAAFTEHSMKFESRKLDPKQIVQDFTQFKAKSADEVTLLDKTNELASNTLGIKSIPAVVYKTKDGSWSYHLGSMGQDGLKTLVLDNMDTATAPQAQPKAETKPDGMGPGSPDSENVSDNGQPQPAAKEMAPSDGTSAAPAAVKAPQ